MIFFDEIFVLAMLLSSFAYWLIIPLKARRFFITLLSLVGLLWLQPKFTLILCLLLAYVYFISRFLLKNESKQIKILTVAVTSVALFLLIGKYSVPIFSTIFSERAFLAKYLIVPLGISYLSFKLIAFVIDVYRGIITEFTFFDLLSFIVFLPTFPAGPIERYQNFFSKHENKFNLDSYVLGIKRIIIGYFKKIVIINFILTEYLTKYYQPKILNNINLEMSGYKIIFFLLLALIYSYIDLSSYADIAIGYSRLFGYKIVEDMDLPIIRPNLSQYWNCWHISLSSWCRNYVYFPVLGSTRLNNFALYSCFLIMGLWHNLSFNWVLWGVWHASGLAVYAKWSRIKKKLIKKNFWLFKITPKPIGEITGAIVTCLFSSMSFSFIFLDGKESLIKDSTNAIKLILAIFV